MVPSNVGDAKQPVFRSSGGPEIDVTVAASRSAQSLEAGFERRKISEEVAHRVRSSISRVSEHRMAPPDV